MVCEAMSTHKNRVDFPLYFIRIPDIQNIHVPVNDKLLLLVVEFCFPYGHFPVDRGFFTKKKIHLSVWTKDELLLT